MIPVNTNTHFHLGAIRAMDVSYKQPLVVTCGKDKTVHIWNYVTKTSEVVKNLSEEPLG